MNEQTDNADRYKGDACMVLMEKAGMGRHCCLTNITMYFFRLGLKDDGHTPREEMALRDMIKAKWYLDRYTSKDYGTSLTQDEFIALSSACLQGLRTLKEVFPDSGVVPAAAIKATQMAVETLRTLEEIGK